MKTAPKPKAEPLIEGAKIKVRLIPSNALLAKDADNVIETMAELINIEPQKYSNSIFIETWKIMGETIEVPNTKREITKRQGRVLETIIIKGTRYYVYEELY